MTLGDRKGYQRLAHCAIPVMFLAATAAPAATAAAQSRPGIAFDQTMHGISTVADRTDSVTSVMHTTAAGGDARIDMDSGKGVPVMGAFSPGSHPVMIMRDGGKEMLILNPEAKQYISIKMFEMMDATQKMIESMGGSMTVDTSVTRISLDSIGPGSAIDGHPTLTYRLTAVIRMTMSMMGNVNVVENQSIQEIQTATDLGGLTALAPGFNRFGEVTRSMGLPKAFLDKLLAARQKMGGFALRTVNHTTVTANGRTRTGVETVETRNLRRLTVPDSLFAVPSDYKSVGLPGVPGMPGP
jgi:hypothetical protein